MTRTLAILCCLTVASAAAAWDEFLVVTTDYSAYGAVSLVDRHAPWTATPDAETVYADAVARWHDDAYWVVNRGASNLQLLDPQAGHATVWQTTLGANRNPQDIAFAAGAAWVPCYDEALLLKVDPANGTVLDTWSTQPFADADGLPETGWTARAAGLVAITCQRLDRNNWWGPADFSQLLLFDPVAEDWVDADAVEPGVQGLVLAGANPSVMPEPVGDGRHLRVGTSGWFGVMDGGIETVDLVGMSTTGFQVTESQLGGDLLDFVTVAPDRAYAVISDASFATAMVAFDLRDGSGVTTVVATSGYDLVDLAFDGVDQVYLSDRSNGAAGIRVFDAATGAELTTAPVTTGRPPFMAVLPVDAATATPPAPARSLVMEAPWPNPANPRTLVAARTTAGATVRFEVLDARGRLLRRAVATADAAGRAAWTWDGLDGDGRPVPSGAYPVRAVAGAATAGTMVTLVR